jgi:hypothetical protein
MENFCPVHNNFFPLDNICNQCLSETIRVLEDGDPLVIGDEVSARKILDDDGRAIKCYRTAEQVLPAASSVT